MPILTSGPGAIPETHTIPQPLTPVRRPGLAPDAGRTQQPWWAWGSRLGQSGSLIGPSGPAVGSKPRQKRPEPHTRVHGDLTITHMPSGAISITHQPHGEDEGDSASPGANDSNSPNYGSGSFDVDTDPLVSDVDIAVGNVHGIGTPGSFEPTLAGGGLDGSAMVTLEDPTSYGDISDEVNDNMLAFKSYGDDAYSPPLREPTKRNYRAGFGADAMGFEHTWYAGFGPAAIIGCEEELIVAGDSACTNGTSVRG